ncbi:NAD-dependent epimerase/dehydratase family protein [Acetobacter ghanensis]|uniref:NAD-dependent epimerase/dehydratase n=1 Tax=Acetobacter ghanensis TaxID=431306 RepID=A0A0U5F698_9PROT|nr:NAD-dependent epimerase/dehydratase family protein [Acetobacter ghanensis]NHO39878.1 NAD-dependent epimerase/dehydratase family protein [Acetobacter ghanensis]GBQ49543.1 UDP-N-acetylglucosamine 4-epimerase [Acetobacter ghanensis DSM 18895]CEF57300.1 NAD-dependent epimerase/dehydratase [Acetobacter ghanensis]
MAFLVTGAAGFIGFHVARALLERGERVVGVDNLTPCPDPNLKKSRLLLLEQYPGFFCHGLDICQPDHLMALAAKEPNIRGIFHFAAQAGVRYSLENPYVFADTNVRGHVGVLELARRLPRLEHLVYASSSSVYGRNNKLPFSETDPVDQPGSFYAVSKRSAELASSTYSYLYGIPQTGLRFFTVYGPWGRPDMAYYSFAQAIREGRPVTLYDGKALSRDFTYIADVVAAVLAVFDKPPPGDKARVLNVGSQRPQSVRKLIDVLEEVLDTKAHIRMAPRPAADVEKTWADISAIRSLTGWRPATELIDGLASFVRWYDFYARA